MKLERLDLREKTLAERSFSTAAFPQVVRMYLDLPREVQGLKILDIGAGGSTAALELQKLGACAIPMDYLYKDLQSFKASVLHSLGSKGQITRRNRKYGERIAKTVSAQARNHGDALVALAMEELVIGDNEAATRVYVQESRKVLDLFLKAKKSGEIKPVAALAGALPFPDQTFDFCFSLQAITTFLSHDREVFLSAINECLRVLKSGGQVQFHPWLIGSSNARAWSRVQRDNAAVILHDLRRRAILCYVEQLGPPLSPRLRIIKP